MSASDTSACVRVLVIEDEPVLAMGLTTLLETLGYRPVGPVASIPKALEVIEQGGFDVALLDVNLRGQWAESVADVLEAKAIPFIIITGYDVDSLPEAYRSRPTLSKPFRANVLAELLANILCRKDPTG